MNINSTMNFHVKPREVLVGHLPDGLGRGRGLHVETKRCFMPI